MLRFCIVIHSFHNSGGFRNRLHSCFNHREHYWTNGSTQLNAAVHAELLQIHSLHNSQLISVITATYHVAHPPHLHPKIDSISSSLNWITDGSSGTWFAETVHQIQFASFTYTLSLIVGKLCWSEPAPPIPSYALNILQTELPNTLDMESNS